MDKKNEVLVTYSYEGKDTKIKRVSLEMFQDKTLIIEYKEDTNVAKISIVDNMTADTELSGEVDKSTLNLIGKYCGVIRDMLKDA